MKLSLEQFLARLDFEIETGLARTLSTGDKVVQLWHAREEEKRSRPGKDFDYRFVLTPHAAKLPPLCVLAPGVKWKIEGEAERNLSASRKKVGYWPLIVFF